MANQDFSTGKSLEILKQITRITHNPEISPVALSIWEKHLQPENPLWGFITAKSFSIGDEAHVIAIIDPRLPELGLVGFFGCKNTTDGSRVLQGACEWLNKEHNIKSIYGPINGTITRDYRFNLSENFRVPGEPVNPRFYIDAFSEAGFKIFNRYVSGISKHYGIFNKLFIRVPPTNKYSDLNLRQFNVDGQMDDLKIYHDLMNQIFPSQSIYCPVISWEERRYNVAGKNPIFDPDYTYFLEDKGSPVGMIIASEYENKLSIDVLGVLKEYRGQHVSGLLIRRVHEQASSEKLEAAIYALIRVGNQVYRMKRPGVKTYRHYITMLKSMP